MISAVIDLATGAIRNVIVAADTDPAFPGTGLVAVPDGASVGMDWRYTDALGFLSPADQRFYVFDDAGNAAAVDLASARAISTGDVETEKAARLALSADATYQAAVTANAETLKAAIADYTFDQCVAFQSSGWPTAPGA